MGMLASILPFFCTNACSKFKAESGYKLEPAEEEARAWVWAGHQEEQTRLLASQPPEDLLSSQDGTGQIRRELLVALQATRQPVLDVATRIADVAAATSLGQEQAMAAGEVTLACVNPGRQGCADSSGSLCWTPVLDKHSGLNVMVRNLGIDVAGLTAPRLREDVCRLPGDLRAACRGRPSYASTAVAWNEQFQADVAPLEQIGGNRRFWFQLGAGSCNSLRVCVLQLPTTADVQADEDWVRELHGLSGDLEALLAGDGGQVLRRVLLMGYMNLQPDELGGGREPQRKRQQCWLRLAARWVLVLHNPHMAGQEHRLFLPRRQREVMVKGGSTRHGPGQGRAIDLVISTADVEVDMCIHNGLNCGGPGVCPMDGCFELATGDPFPTTGQPQ